MNRRSFLRFLGVAPVAIGTAAVAAPSGGSSIDKLTLKLDAAPFEAMRLEAEQFALDAEGRLASAIEALRSEMHLKASKADIMVSVRRGDMW